MHFVSGSTGNKALHNTLKNNDIMSRNDADHGDNDSGAWGVLLNASGNEVAHNSFSGNIACSEDYGIEGASVEIYHAGNNLIRHNSSVNDSTFSELGGQSEGNTFAFNLFAPLNETSQKAAEFLIVPGNKGTRVYNNTAYKVQVGLACFRTCDTSVLDFRNNIVVGASNARKSEFYSDAVPLESHNVFGRIDAFPQYFSGGSSPPASTLLLSAGQTNTLFVSSSESNFRLGASSAAVDAGNPELTFLAELGISTDLDNRPVPYGRAPDAGAYERQY
ncbi:choice-of-anchor Q domain-containing protein [Deinococcus peraridilitoris]|uniref:choice-of-anchor Q domain-containing protein n=1 Tax=Deinococcus peraridilitoris TaxID=432329 RepID=UPI00059C1136|nr:choice-of-anchor Q domain-containing protein [Deinococcus peraridilitoris]